MSLDLFMSQVFTNLVETVGSPELACFLIMVVLFLGMLYCGLEFDYSLVLISPIPYAFYQAGYLEVWIAALFIILPLGGGIYFIWLKFNNRG